MGKISGLNAKTTIHDTDLFPMVDIEAETDETKKITGANMREWRKSWKIRYWNLKRPTLS